MHRPSGCPSCAEPLEEGDRFCGVCGYAVTALPPAPAGDRPTIPIPPAPRPPRAADGGYGAPAAGMGHGVAEPAPGWGSVAAAAPTLVGDPADWAATPPAQQEQRREQEPDPERQRDREPRQPARPTAAPAPAQAPARYDLPGGGTPPEGTPWGSPEHHGAGADGARAPYDVPGGHTPPEGTGTATGRENPYASPAPGAPWSAPESASPAINGTTPSNEDPYGASPPAPGEAGTPPDGTPWGAGAGKTCVACRAGHVDTDGYCEHCGHAQPRERDHQEEELGSVAAVSDRGLRHHRNEDSFAVAATALPDGSAATVAIVCDGVSSASRPDEASAAASGAANEALLDALPRGAHPQEAMHEAILAAAAAVNALAPEVPGAQNAPACTLVGAVVSGGLLTIGWVGDSRAYWVPDDRAALPRRLTEDDSWAAQMVAAGLMGEAEAYADVRAHAITGWLGADAYDLEPHTATFKPDHPGVVVVCTDGLWNYAESAREMAQVLPADAATRPLHSAQVLVGHALDGGGHDNVTVAVVPFAAQPDAPPEQEAEADARPRG
ncbi:protein phosphatase 2C domain-containing protein [Streptomyces sp. NPDC055254]